MGTLIFSGCGCGCWRAIAPSKLRMLWGVSGCWHVLLFLLCLLRPALLAEGHFLAGFRSAAVDFALPGEVLAQSELGVAGVVEVDLGNLGLNECPHAPVMLLLVSTGSVSFGNAWWNRWRRCFAHQ